MNPWEFFQLPLIPGAAPLPLPSDGSAGWNTWDTGARLGSLDAAGIRQDYPEPAPPPLAGGFSSLQIHLPEPFPKAALGGCP